MTKRTERPREIRSPLAGRVDYESGCGEAGQACWKDISRTGMAVRLGRYLRPGRTLTLRLAGGLHEAEWTLSTTVVWCTRVPGSLEFDAGLQVDRRCPETALRFATLGYEALAMNKITNFTVTPAGCLAHRAVTRPHTSLGRRSQAV